MNNQATSDLITAFILRLALVIFAIYGVLYLAPRVGEVLRDKMIRAVEIKSR